MAKAQKHVKKIGDIDHQLKTVMSLRVIGE